MVSFLILVHHLEKYSKKDINHGKTPKSIYTLCCAIREAFCLSYNIRKENNVFLYFQDSHILIKLVGRKLRYLGPDERSQTILVNKALKLVNPKTNKKDTGWIPSTPGFFIRKFPSNDSFLRYFETIVGEIPLLVTDKPFKKVDSSIEEIQLNSITRYESSFFIIPAGKIDDLNQFIQKMYDFIPSMKNINLPQLHFSFERILFINYKKDKKSQTIQQ
ncbi:MAG: hypothetical protein R6U96_01070 [Promethearchaeia archaeon]